MIVAQPRRAAKRPLASIGRGFRHEGGRRAPRPGGLFRIRRQGQDERRADDQGGSEPAGPLQALAEKDPGPQQRAERLERAEDRGGLRPHALQSGDEQDEAEDGRAQDDPQDRPPRGRTAWQTGMESIARSKAKRVRAAGEKLWRQRFQRDPLVNRMRFDVAVVTFDDAGAPSIEYARGVL